MAHWFGKRKMEGSGPKMLLEAVSFSPDDPDKQVQAGGTADGVGGHVPAAKDIEDDGKGKQNQKALTGYGAGNDQCPGAAHG